MLGSQSFENGKRLAVGTDLCALDSNQVHQVSYIYSTDLDLVSKSRYFKNVHQEDK